MRNFTKYLVILQVLWTLGRKILVVLHHCRSKHLKYPTSLLKVLAQFIRISLKLKKSTAKYMIIWILNCQHKYLLEKIVKTGTYWGTYFHDFRHIFTYIFWNFCVHTYPCSAHQHVWDGTSGVLFCIHSMFSTLLV